MPPWNLETYLVSYLPETNLQDDRNLSQLFAEFYMALIDGEEWSSFKKFQAKNKNHD